MTFKEKVLSLVNSIIKIMNKSAQKKRTEWYKANDVRMYNFIEKFNHFYRKF